MLYDPNWSNDCRNDWFDTMKTEITTCPPPTTTATMSAMSYYTRSIEEELKSKVEQLKKEEQKQYKKEIISKLTAYAQQLRKDGIGYYWIKEGDVNELHKHLETAKSFDTVAKYLEEND